MTLDNKTITTLVLDWLNKESYSKQHWEAVAKDSLKKANNNTNESIKLMANSIEQFHYLYMNNLIRENNVLHELLSRCFEKVQWDIIAKHFIDNI